MRPEERDAAHLWNLLVAGRRIQEFIAGVRLDEYIRHALLPSAVERQFEILGEETRKVSTTFREKHPEIPWRQNGRPTEHSCASLLCRRPSAPMEHDA
jgi:uncharacterized protein with HEPN domain